MGLFHMRIDDDLKAGLASKAQAQGVTMTEYVTALLTTDLAEDTRAASHRRWQEENRAGIEDWNARIAQGGLPLAHLAVTKPDFDETV